MLECENNEFEIIVKEKSQDSDDNEKMESETDSQLRDN